MENKQHPVPKQLSELEAYFKTHVGLGISFDIGIRKIKVFQNDIHLYFLNGLSDTSYIVEILEYITDINEEEPPTAQIYNILSNRIVHQQVQPTDQLETMIDSILSGLIAIVVDGAGKAILVDVRSYPGRTPQEPDTEKVVRGSRDGYVENIIMNTALTRRRIRDPRLRMEMMKVGKRSKTDICLSYIDGVANPNLVETIRKEISSIDIDGIPMADKVIEEYIVKQGLNPYPLVRYTERADVGADHLLEGHVILFVDTSPSAMIMPTTFFHHTQHAEEYRQAATVGTVIKWIRFIGILASLFVLPLWYLFIIEPHLLPKVLAFIGPNKKTHIPLILQIILADIGMEFLRIAAIHTPTPLATAMGLVAAVLIGQIAIDVGLFTPEVILYVAVSTIGTYATPSYELSVANRIVRIILLLIVAFFKLPGFVIGMTIYLIYMAKTKTLNVPYLWPLLPFNPSGFLQIILRRSVPGSKVRPSVVRPRDRFRQPR